jgi:hypothetical protein
MVLISGVLIGLAVLFYAARGIGQETTTASPEYRRGAKAEDSGIEAPRATKEQP